MNELTVKLQYLLPSLPRAEKKAADFFVQNMDSIQDMTLHMVSEESQASEATILRLCRKMGYSSFVHFKQVCAQHNFDNSHQLFEHVHKQDNISQIFDKVIFSVKQSLDYTRTLFDQETYQNALNAILNAHTLCFVATGDAVSVCTLASSKFNRVGIPSIVCSNPSYQYETAMRLTSKDVLIALSASGRSKNIVQSTKLAKESGAVTIVITQSAKSPILHYTDISLITSTIDMTSARDTMCKRITELTILETLYLGVICHGSLDYDKMLQYTLESFEMNTD